MLHIHLADNTPPLFDVLLFFWIKGFGTGAFSVRFLPMLFSSCTVIFVYLAGKRIAGMISGLTAALLFTFSTFHMYFAHEARAYSLFALLSSASLYYYFCLDERGSRRYFSGFIISNVLLAYTHYFGFLVIGAELVFSFLFLKSFPFVFRKIWLGFITWLALISPLLLFVLKRYHTVRKTGFWVTAPPWDAWYENIRKFCNEPVVAVCFLVFLVSGTVMLIRKRAYRGNPPLLILPLWFVGIYFALFGFSFWIPVFLDRYLIFLSIPLYLFIGMCIPLLSARRNYQLLLALCLSLGMAVTLNLKPGNDRDPVGMAAFVNAQKDSATAVYIAPPWLDKGLMYYCRPDLFNDEAHFDQRMEQEHWFRVYNLQEISGKLLPGTHRVVYAASGSAWLGEGAGALPDSIPGFHRILLRKFGLTDAVLVFER